MHTWCMPNAPLCYQPVLQGDPPLSAGGRWGATGTDLGSIEPKVQRMLTQFLEPKWLQPTAAAAAAGLPPLPMLLLQLPVGHCAGLQADG